MAAPKTKKTAGAHVALLRGVNVGGKNILPMKELVAMFTDAGAADAKSYIQSGNVVFRAPPALAARIPALIAERIGARFELKIRVLSRSAEELRAIVDGNPFVREGADPKTLHVVFLGDAPDADRIGALAPMCTEGERLEARGRELYLCCPNGLGRSKLTNQIFDSRLRTVSTVRNWRTVQKLLELAGG